MSEQEKPCIHIPDIEKVEIIPPFQPGDLVAREQQLRFGRTTGRVEGCHFDEWIRQAVFAQ